MRVKAYFEDIHKIIIANLRSAEKEIRVAVAWFTDPELFNELCKKAQQGIDIKIILINDQINCGQGKLNFIRLKNYGCQVEFLDVEKFNKMHHKFCVIDGSVVITGSYNWTNQARKNEENITVIEGNVQICQDYLDIFEKLLNPSSSSFEIAISPNAVKTRLEIIKNSILLDEVENIAVQVGKLKPVIQTYSLGGICRCLEQGEYQQAVEEIANYLKNFTAVIVSEDNEILELKFELKILELRLEAITNEQSDIERNLILFNRRQFEILGDITKEILRAKAEYHKYLSDEKDNNKETANSKKEEAEQAEQDFTDYSEEYEEIRQTIVDSLDEMSEKELKLMFKKACNICHPDKVPEAQKEEASEIFIKLKDAYDNNDIAQVKIIYANLQKGNFTHTKASILKENELLRSAIMEIKYKIESNLNILKNLKQDDVVVAMQSIGENEEKWIAFFKSKRERLESELLYWLAALDNLKKGENYE
ncbi:MULTISPECIES: phospholipase D-like domain-containing protein [Acinetobacter]|mgnify:CR=1 FL=1|nr:MULTISPECIES: phospholipase D-like domain-containing protein [Acinetobacter]NUF65311.1 DUF1669 domain-containing protein [Acinetobacter bereziniae]NUG65851.1 DUF1669 domain-containing protein [Acinetobacter bereziniae]